MGCLSENIERRPSEISKKRLGAVAQLGARLTGSQKVEGSTPSSSTKMSEELSLRGFSRFAFFKRGRDLVSKNKI